MSARACILWIVFAVVLGCRTSMHSAHLSKPCCCELESHEHRSCCDPKPDPDSTPCLCEDDGDGNPLAPPEVLPELFAIPVVVPRLVTLGRLLPDPDSRFASEAPRGTGPPRHARLCVWLI